MQWSSLNYEPWHKPGRIGPRTNERIFELMLRLRANYYWPAMHECTEPFSLRKETGRWPRNTGFILEAPIVNLWLQVPLWSGTDGERGSTIM